MPLNFKDKRPFLIQRLRIEIRGKELKDGAMRGVGLGMAPHGMLYFGLDKDGGW